MQTLWLPTSICDHIDSTMCNFIWQENPFRARGWSLVKWDHITRPKKLSGLGIHRTQLSNIAMLGKLVWDLLAKPKKLWL